MRNYLKYDDTQVFKYDSLVLAVVYTIGHILIAMTCNRIITGAPVIILLQVIAIKIWPIV